MIFLEALIEILKYTVPTVIVYFLMRQFLQQQLQVSAMEKKSELKKESLALRFQAYERLVLFCERIKLSDLTMRLMTKDMSSNALKNAILISIQKEFEHNITQQLFVSSQLWEMIQLYKDNIVSVITASYIKNERTGIENFVNDLYEIDRELETKMGVKVKQAIRKEVELYFQ